jgi:hypothetical protein
MATPKPDPTLQTVLDGLSGVAGLSAKKRADLTSAIWVFSRDLGRRPSEIPARTDIVERLGRRLSAARLGIAQGSLANVKSRVRVSMRLTGYVGAALRLNFALGPVWQELVRLAGEPSDRIILKRLFRILQLQGVGPATLSQAAFDGVRLYLYETGASRPDAVYRNMVIAWNRLNRLLRSSPI